METKGRATHGAGPGPFRATADCFPVLLDVVSCVVAAQQRPFGRRGAPEARPARGWPLSPGAGARWNALEYVCHCAAGQARAAQGGGLTSIPRASPRASTRALAARVPAARLREEKRQNDRTTKDRRETENRKRPAKRRAASQPEEGWTWGRLVCASALAGLGRTMRAAARGARNPTVWYGGGALSAGIDWRGTRTRTRTRARARASAAHERGRHEADRAKRPRRRQDRAHRRTTRRTRDADGTMPVRRVHPPVRLRSGHRVASTPRRAGLAANKERTRPRTGAGQNSRTAEQQNSETLEQ